MLLTLPAALQLGVENGGAAGGAAGGGEGGDGAAAETELAVLLAATPRAMWSARLGLALWAETRRGAASPFAAYLAELPATLSSCLAPAAADPDAAGAAGAAGGASDGEVAGDGGGGDASAALAAWPPTAARAAAMRASLRSLHAQLRRTASARAADAPTLSQLRWAAAIAGSRAYRVRGAPGEAEGDAARLLPIVDLANYAPTGAGANAELRNAPATRASSEGGSDDPRAVSLYAVEAIPVGGDVLIDYGCGAPLSNERLLLEYGFVLRPHPHDRLVLPLGAIAVGLAAVAAAEEEEARGEDREQSDEGGGEDGGEDGGAAEAAALGAAQQRLLAQLGDVEAAGLAFGADGTPLDETLALALVLTARRAADLAPAAAPLELVAAARGADGGASAAARRARCALHAVAAEALEQVAVAIDAGGGGGTGSGGGGFDEAAGLYCESRRGILERACEELASR